MTQPTPIASGTVFAGEFRILRPLARGGMGAVYVAEQIGTGRERALKVMHPILVDDETSRERFAQEALVSAGIDSDHVVEVIRAGVDEATGMPWIAMELLKGETLAERVRRLGRLSSGEVREIFQQLAHALSAAHEKGIVHRDLKPENIFLEAPRREGVPFTVKVLDFGIAKVLNGIAHTASRGIGVGSPLWMAPEQANASELSPAADVWALGLLAFYALTGLMYWKSASAQKLAITSVLMEIMVDPMAPASERAYALGSDVELPAAFDAWFQKAVSRNLFERFEDAKQAIDALLPFLETKRISVRTELPTGPATPVGSLGAPAVFETGVDTVHLRAPALESARPPSARTETGAPVTTRADTSHPPSGRFGKYAIASAIFCAASLALYVAALRSNVGQPEQLPPTVSQTARPPRLDPVSSSPPRDPQTATPLGARNSLLAPQVDPIPPVGPPSAPSVHPIAHPDTPRSGAHRPRPGPSLRGPAREIWNHAIDFCWRDAVRARPLPATPVKIIARIGGFGRVESVRVEGDVPRNFRLCIVTRLTDGFALQSVPAIPTVVVEVVLPEGP